MPRVAFIDAEQRTFAERLQVGEALEVGDRHELAAERGEHRYVVGDEVMVRHRHHRKVEADHSPDTPRPKTRCVHDMLGDDGALLGDDIPLAVGALPEIKNPVTQHEIRAAAPRGDGERVRRAMRIDIAFVRVIEAALGTSAEMWLAMQVAYDLWQARQKKSPKVTRIIVRKAA